MPKAQWKHLFLSPHLFMVVGTFQESFIRLFSVAPSHNKPTQTPYNLSFPGIYFYLVLYFYFQV